MGQNALNFSLRTEKVYLLKIKKWDSRRKQGMAFRFFYKELIHLIPSDFSLWIYLVCKSHSHFLRYVPLFTVENGMFSTHKPEITLQSSSKCDYNFWLASVVFTILNSIELQEAIWIPMHLVCINPQTNCICYCWLFGSYTDLQIFFLTFFHLLFNSF